MRVVIMMWSDMDRILQVVGMLAACVRSISSVEELAGRRLVWPRSQGVCRSLVRKTRQRVYQTLNWFLKKKRNLNN